MISRRGICLSLIALTFSHQALAESISTTIHHQYQSPRAMGMGDAFVAAADDYSAIFYNPAGLARREDGQINLSMSYAATPGAKDFLDEYSAVESNRSLSDTERQTAYLELIQKHYGDVYSFRISPLEAAWVRPQWGIALIPVDVSVEMAMHQQIGPTINATVYADTTLGLAYADDLHWFNYGRLSWGITGKFVNRGFFSKRISSIDLAASSEIVSKSDLQEGYTGDADIGILWTPEIPDSGLWSLLKVARPTFGAVVRNVGEFGFGHSMKLLNKDPSTASTEQPEKLYRVLDLGSRWEYPSFWIFGGRGLLDVKDLGHPDFNWRKGVHVGLEFDWTVSSWWKGHYRGGLNGADLRFWTAGVSAELAFFNIDLVTYADDVGTRNTPVESRVYATRLNMDF